MDRQYVERRDDGGYWIKDTRVSLDSLLYEFENGASPESIQRSYSTLTLEEVYGALTFYLANRSEIDRYLDEANVKEEGEANHRRDEFCKGAPALYSRLKNARVLMR